MLWLVTSMPIVIGIPQATASLLSVPVADAPWVLAAIAGGTGFAAALAWRLYLTSAIRTDEEGISQHSPLGRKTIPWAEGQPHAG